jgi:predicted esterase
MEQPLSFSFPVGRTARFHTLGQAGYKTRRLLFACHGYGQLAGRFIYKFTEQLDGQTYVVAPEGLSRFYLDGSYTDIGASWMTREDREQDIADNRAYLSALYTQTLQLLPADTQRVLFGFSQGCSTLTRWIAQEQPAFDALILWGGAFAEDMDYRGLRDYFSDKKIWLVHGDQDPFVTPEQLEKLRRFTEAQGLVYHNHCFSGRHEVDRAVLGKVLDWL